MARSGIYVNGKEIVARYVGDKLVWKKSAGQWVDSGVMVNPTMNIIDLSSVYFNSLYEYDMKRPNFDNTPNCKVMLSGTYYYDVTVRQNYSQTFDGRGFIQTLYIYFQTASECTRFKRQFSNNKINNKTNIIEVFRKG